MTMTIRHTMKMTIRRLQWTVREFGRDWTNWLNMCFLPSPTCASNIEQSHFLSAGGLTLITQWFLVMMVDITAMMMRTEGPEPGTLDFGSAQHSARKGKNRLYVCHFQSLSCQDNPGELHDVHHVRVGLFRDWSTFFQILDFTSFFNPSSLIHSIWCAITTLFSALNSPISLCLSGNVFRIPTNTAARVKARQYLPTLATLSSSSSSSSSY